MGVIYSYEVKDSLSATSYKILFSGPNGYFSVLATYTPTFAQKNHCVFWAKIHLSDLKCIHNKVILPYTWAIHYTCARFFLLYVVQTGL